MHKNGVILEKVKIIAGVKNNYVKRNKITRNVWPCVSDDVLD
jgi:hypothetical protein